MRWNSYKWSINVFYGFEINLHPLTSDTAVRTAVSSASSQTGILFLIPWWLQNLFTLRKLQPFRFGYRLLISTTRSSYVCFCWIRKQRTKSSSRTPSNAAITVWYSRQNTDITSFQAFGSERRRCHMYRNEKWKTKFKSVFQSGCENEKWKTKGKSVFQSKAINKIRKPKFKSVFQSDAKTKHEKRNSNPFFKVMRKRKTKTEIQIPFSKCGENEKRNSNPFFNVTSRQKTKNRNGNGIPFYKAKEKRKIKWNLNSIFLCHRKTVSTKVHTVAKVSDSVCSQTTFGSSTSISQCC